MSRLYWCWQHYPGAGCKEMLWVRETYDTVLTIVGTLWFVWFFAAVLLIMLGKWKPPIP